MKFLESETAHPWCVGNSTIGVALSNVDQDLARQRWVCITCLWLCARTLSCRYFCCTPGTACSVSPDQWSEPGAQALPAAQGARVPGTGGKPGVHVPPQPAGTQPGQQQRQHAALDQPDRQQLPHLCWGWGHRGSQCRARWGRGQPGPGHSHAGLACGWRGWLGG